MTKIILKSLSVENKNKTYRTLSNAGMFTGLITFVLSIIYVLQNKALVAYGILINKFIFMPLIIMIAIQLLIKVLRTSYYVRKKIINGIKCIYVAEAVCSFAGAALFVHILLSIFGSIFIGLLLLNK